MGKKPVLGLAGLCVGLALTGCKDCECGWGRSSRKDHGHQARVQRVEKGESAEVSKGEGRKRSVADQSIAGKGGDPARLKNQYEFPVDSHKVPTPAAVETVETPTARETVPLETSDPAGLKAGKGIDGLEEPATIPEKKAAAKSDPVVPPPMPMTIGDKPSKSGVAEPVKIQPAEIVPETKLPADANLGKDVLTPPSAKELDLSGGLPKKPVAPTKSVVTPAVSEVKKAASGSELSPPGKEVPAAIEIAPPAGFPEIVPAPTAGTAPSPIPAPAPVLPESKPVTPPTSEPKTDLELGAPPSAPQPMPPQ